MNCLLKSIKRYKKDINSILSRRNLLSLHNSHFHNKNTYETNAFLYYEPEIKKMILYNKKKKINVNLNDINKLYYQQHLFYTTQKKKTKIHDFLSYVGYDFHKVNDISQLIHDTFHLNYSIIWIDMNTTSDIDICYIIYILRVIYQHQNPIVLVTDNILNFQIKYESDDNILEKTETPNFMSFNFIKYIEEQLSVNISVNTRELVTFHDISKENIAQFANDQFYLGCNIIKATFRKKSTKT